MPNFIELAEHVLGTTLCCHSGKRELPARNSDSGLDFSFGEDTGIDFLIFLETTFIPFCD